MYTIDKTQGPYTLYIYIYMYMYIYIYPHICIFIFYASIFHFIRFLSLMCVPGIVLFLNYVYIIMCVFEFVCNIFIELFFMFYL